MAYMIIITQVVCPAILLFRVSRKDKSIKTFTLSIDKWREIKYTNHCTDIIDAGSEQSQFDKAMDVNYIPNHNHHL